MPRANENHGAFSYAQVISYAKYRSIIHRFQMNFLRPVVIGANRQTGSNRLRKCISVKPGIFSPDSKEFHSLPLDVAPAGALLFR
jgi:hypothetical protein